MNAREFTILTTNLGYKKIKETKNITYWIRKPKKNNPIKNVEHSPFYVLNKLQS